MIPIKPYQNNSLLYVWATPKAAKNRIGEIVLDQDQQPYLKVYVTAIAEKGLANKAIISLLSKTFSIPKSNFQITAGEVDRRKCLLISMPYDELSKRFKESMGLLF
jgi:uncharacterized protein YggU (UPF0235/DUF167 family)